VRDYERALQENSDRQHEAESDRPRAVAEQQRLDARATELEAQAAGLEVQQHERQGAVDEARQLRNRVQQEVQEWEMRRSTASDQLSHTRLSLSDVEHRFARLEDRLREDVDIELRRCLGEIEGMGLEGWGLEGASELQGPAAPSGVVDELQGPPLSPAVLGAWRGLQRLWERDDFDVAETRKEVQVLQSQRDRLGAVNLDAVEELDEEEGQFTTLEQEVGDLKEARRALMETLKKLEAESKLLFEQTFHEARKNFQEIFRKLFQGGKADMFLSFGGPDQAEDLLEAGIEIVAQPPGKQLQSINLLSGGERSLTAVAILFALFKVRPSPFCILDEVDAALDETNVERFLRVLRDFTDDTQFCIVTHHKRTMAECQVLYGITMQRRGVSSRIAVAMHEVDSFHGDAVAGASGGSANGGGANGGGAVAAGSGADPALKRRIAGEEQVGFN
jgi:chromosome segregation protein